MLDRLGPSCICKGVNCRDLAWCGICGWPGCCGSGVLVLVISILPHGSCGWGGGGSGRHGRLQSRRAVPCRAASAAAVAGIHVFGAGAARTRLERQIASYMQTASCSTSGSLPQQDTPKQPPASPTDQACIQASVWVWKVLVCLGAVDGQQYRHSDVNGIAFK